MESRIGRLVVVLFAAVFGLFAGYVVGFARHLAAQPGDYPFLTEYASLPHHVPKFEGGASFRFAMAHDVLHERFPRHGPAYYRERDRITREKLSTLASGAPLAFSLTDDLAAGLDRLGRSDEAIDVMRDKLARQQANGLAGPILYTTHANLGTFLIHASHGKAIAGDARARERFREGVGFIRKSVELNPQAHFGREQWQAVIAEFLLAAMEKPELLKTFDCLGNRLDLDIEQILNREGNWVHTGYGRPTDASFSQGRDEDVLAFFEVKGQLDDPSRWEELSPIRKHITKVGAEHGWEDVPVPSHRKPVSFDEPMLGIIGMWRQGGGANPHFALALGESMLRVGQRYIAWSAYERAARMADHFWPDAKLQQFLRDHCRKRQTQIEETLTYQAPPSSRRPAWQHVSPPPPSGTVEGLRSAFESELAYGEDYQRAYQKYEEEKIAAGTAIGDAKFFDDFHSGREPIASPSGSEEWFPHIPRAKVRDYASSQSWAWGVFGAGLAAMIVVLLERLLAWFNATASASSPP